MFLKKHIAIKKLVLLDNYLNLNVIIYAYKNYNRKNKY